MQRAEIASFMHAATRYFKSCGIYNGGDCARFCHSLQAQYWGQQSSSQQCFKVTPSLIVLQRIYVFCMYRCAYLKKKIRQYRIDGVNNANFSPSRFGWKASNINALIYLTVNSRGSVKSRVLVYTSNPSISSHINKNGIQRCTKIVADFNKRVCSNCLHYRAVCPSCCRSMGFIWV